jgi:alanyl-tRNA synthetase
VVPGNEGRGYVLRRLIRRAIRHSRNLGVKDGFLGDLANLVISRMGLVYPELRNHQDFILTVLKLEEERFQQVFSKGYTMLTDALKGSKVLSGDVAFKLWDTYGFPVEMTQEIANEISVDVDLVGFNDSLDKQRQRARKSARFDGDRTAVRIYNSLGVGSTKFLGYDEITASSVIIGLISNGQPVNEINNTENAEVILLETPFYAEGGGQVGDVGELIGPNGKIEINDTQMAIPGLIVHRGKVICGSVSKRKYS